MKGKRSQAPSKRKQSPLLLETQAESSVSESSTRHASTSSPPKSIPRSKYGCWTCRVRKVKCDEARPICGHCQRLQYACDYTIKHSFKDETTKVVRKYLGPHSSLQAWDPTAQNLQDASESSTRQDQLPEFPSLRNDEERQKKASFARPGTYFVMADQASFSNSADYSQGENKPVMEWHEFGGLFVPIMTDTSNDPNTIVLANFDDERVVPRVPSWTSTEELSLSLTRSSTSSQPSSMPGSPLLARRARISNMSTSVPFSPRYDESVIDLVKVDEDSLWAHYRSFTRRKIFRYHSNPTTEEHVGEDDLELRSKTSRPLRYALLALTAMSSARRQTNQSVEYYHNSVSSLRAQNVSDLTATDNFLTHFVLLLYEVASTSNLWPMHMERLQTMLSAQTTTTLSSFVAQFRYAIDVIYRLDLTALMSGISQGQCVTVLQMLQLHELASPETVTPHTPHVLYRKYQEYHGRLLQLQGQIGAFANQKRAIHQHGTDVSTASMQALDAEWTESCSSMIKELQHFMTQEVTLVSDSTEEVIAAEEHVLSISDECYICGRAMLCYLLACMWPAQRPHRQSQIDLMATASSEVIDRAFQIQCGPRHTTSQLFVLYLFIAALTTPYTTKKQLVLQILATLEHESLGSNTRATKSVLEEICSLQSEAGLQGRHYLDVDWMGYIEKTGLKMIHFGL